MNIDLPSGLSFDKRTGVISGICNEELHKTYTITAKNVWNEVRTKFNLLIKSII